jgi:hypothetical protein
MVLLLVSNVTNHCSHSKGPVRKTVLTTTSYRAMIALKMPGHGIPISKLSKADLWSTTLLFPGLGFAALALSTIPGLLEAPSCDAWMARAIVAAIVWLFSWLCAAGRLSALAIRGSWVPLQAASHPMRAAALLVTVVGLMSAGTVLAIIRCAR